MSQASLYGFGADCWPGLGKLVEECGELSEVLGKLIGTGGGSRNWDGGDLNARLAEEMADVVAAIRFFVDHNPFDGDAIDERVDMKYARFLQWHAELEVKKHNPFSPACSRHGCRDRSDPFEVCPRCG